MMKYIYLLRPKHWVKNLFLFAAPFFGGSLFLDKTLAAGLRAFVAFSLCCSAAYIFNDIRDLENDRHHPKKNRRLIASGKVGPGKAFVFAGLLAATAGILAIRISGDFFYYVFLYLSLQILYSVRLKSVAIVDIFCIASGFVIRVLAGGAAFHVRISQWLIITMFMISLVLAAGKRLGEFSLLNEKAENHRKSLGAYSASTLNEILLISSSAALVSYVLYVVEQFQTLIYTVPVVTFGLFRYLLLSKGGLGDPTEAMTRDKWLAITVILWLLMVGLIRYN